MVSVAQKKTDDEAAFFYRKTDDVQQLLMRLDEQDIRYVVIDKHTGDATMIDGAIDMVVSEDDLERLPRMINAYCNERGCRLVQVFHDQASADCFVLTARCGNQTAVFQLNVCTASVQGGETQQSAGALFDARVRNASGLWVPSALGEFKYTLCKLLTKQVINPCQLARLSTLRAHDPTTVDAWLQDATSPDVGRKLRRSLDQQSLPAFRTLMPALREALVEKQSLRLTDRLKALGRLASRMTRPSGMTLGFLGPDGVGKSTVIAELERRIAPAFRNQARFHLRPHFGRRRRASGSVANPHVEQPRGVVGSTAKLALLGADYVSGYVQSVYPGLVQSTLVIFDRYADDLLVDPRRHRYGGPMWMAQLLNRVIPRPDLLFVLSAAPEVIQARKSQVPVEETARQLDVYRTLAQRDKVILIDADRPVDAVVNTIVEETVNWLARRTHKRLGFLP